MTEPFIGEIRMVSFGVLPKGWAFCNGQTLAISQNQALFSLLGTSYGGDGRTTFALPNLQSRIPLHVGVGYTQGELGGEATHTLITSELPTHTHLVSASSATGDQGAPNHHVEAGAGVASFGTANDVSMASGAVSTTGGSQPHENHPPYLVVNFMVALVGIFPSR